ncbi:retron St85 family RNA-directed DNA polymerase [Devosia sp. Naph2]|uniref:retron St85 family RNA-directed DNA polymerase n=1 Tax=Devosia polycyclovorans TaxID=3345148 RepID=UPI0035CFED00
MSLLEELHSYTGLGYGELASLVRTAPQRYKAYLIPKRGVGHRMIAQPAKELKYLQYFLIDRALGRLPVHVAATAYREGISIRANASLHAKSEVMLKLDFKDFFPSIRVRDWASYCASLDRDFATSLGLASSEDVAIAGRILFWGKGGIEPRCLSIGAPSSPVLSNVLMNRFDSEVMTQAVQLGVCYSRYADDITLSGESSKTLLMVESAIRRYVRRHRSPALTLNEEKRGLYTSGQRRMVTGLIITPDERISLGRDRKRMISSLVHRFTLNQLDQKKIAYLQGMIAFARDAEPSFYGSLVKKYGNSTLHRLLEFRLPKG